MVSAGAHEPSSRKLLVLRPFFARLTTAASGPNAARKPGPQPPWSLTVESPTSTMRTAGRSCAVRAPASIRRAIGRRLIAPRIGDSPVLIEWPRAPFRLAPLSNSAARPQPAARAAQAESLGL